MKVTKLKKGKAIPLKKSGKPYKFKASTRRKMSQAHTGKKLSEETRAKISAARREREALIQQGFLQPFRHSPETKRKLSRIMKKAKHKPSRKAVLESVKVRQNLGKDRRIAKAVMKGKL